MPLSCLIVDDSQEFLRAARTLLEREGIDVAGTATTSAEALRAVRERRPDVVLVDVSLGEESGFELARRLADEPGLGSKVILISTRAERDIRELIAANPAAGFVHKAQLSAQAIRGVLDGRPSEGAG